MVGSGAADTHDGLSPRTPTFLARYSRQSKLTVALLTLVGGVAFSYLSVVLFSSDNYAAKKAENHAPRITSQDVQKKEELDLPENTKAYVPSPVASGASGAINDQDDKSITLKLAPDPGLVESSPQGDLPRIGEDGRQPWQVYARPFNIADTRPRVAIVVSDLGRINSLTDQIVKDLPANVTLAFDVQGQAVGSWLGRARQEGHELLLSIPMEPFDYPRSDPGPHTLLTSIPNMANLEKLNWALRQASGYVGILTLTGSRFTSDTAKFGTVMDVMQKRGLMVLDSRVAPHGVVTDLAHEAHVPVAATSIRIDEDLSPEAIDAAFARLEQTARMSGKAVAVVPPIPLVITHLQNWLKTLPQQGIALAPVSALVQ